MTGRHSFERPERLRRSAEFRRARKRGSSYRDGVFVLTICENGLSRHRLGLSLASSKVSLASRRNRLKRLIREVFRAHKDSLKGGHYDIIVSLMKAPFDRVGYAGIEKRLIGLYKKAQIL